MTTFIRTASTTTFQFTAQGDQLIVPAGGHIWVEAAGGVFTYDSNSIYVNGEIDSGYSGIYVQSNANNNTSEIIVGSSGNVVGSTAFWLDGNATIQNAGQISGGVGIYSTTGSYSCYALQHRINNRPVVFLQRRQWHRYHHQFRSHVW